MSPTKKPPRRQQRSESSEPTPGSVEPLFPKPEYVLPDLPRDISTISDGDLMQTFTDFVGWQNYAAAMLVTCEVAEHEADNRVRFIESQKMLQSWTTSSKDSVTKVKGEVSQDPEVEKARNDALRAYAERKYTKMIYENCERSAQLLSRELSRRIGRDGTERRQQRWTP
jgi:hypothetical protein